MNKSGIYTFTNLINNKIYLGCSKNIYIRRDRHLWSLRNNKHENQYFQNAFNKYGEFCFKWEPFLSCDIEFLKSEENHWCNLLDLTNREHGYNIRPTNPLTHSMSIETRNKISLHNMGRISPMKGKKFTQEHKTNMSNGMRGKKHIYSKNTKKTYHSYCISRIGNKNPFFGKYHSVETINKNIEFHSKSIIQYSVDGGFIKEWKSAKKVNNELGWDQANINKCCNNKKITAYGYIWKFK